LAAAYLLGFLSSLGVVEIMGLKAYHAPLWIPIFFACFLLALAPLSAPVFGRLRVNSKATSVIGGNLRTFLIFWFACVVVVLTYGFVMGWVMYLVGGSRRDMVEMTDSWSIPFGWVNSAFIIRPEKSLAAVIGIVTANCYVWALGLTLVYKSVHYLRRRNRVTELGISTKTLDEDDEGYTIGS
jgi:hypothetical protein